MPKSSVNASLSSYDDIFSTEESRQEEQREQVQQIPIGELFPFKNHPFKVLDDDSMSDTVESVKQYGVLSPLIARPRPKGGYEIISGHRRQHAAELAGLETLPVIVRQMDDDAAIILMVDSNLQREHTANEPKVSFRNGRYYVTDGQHTIEARILRNGGKDLPILCKIYTGLTMQQEALFFAEQNGHAAPLTAGIKLRAKVVGEDAPSVAFLAATNRVGLDFNYDSLQLSDYRISCVGTALKLYNQMGEKIYCEALRLIVAAWEGKPDSFRASVLRGMMHFVELYHGEFSEERLIRALRSVHPMEIYRSGMDNPAKLPGWKKYVFPIYMAYNGKCRKDALPMKF